MSKPKYYYAVVNKNNGNLLMYAGHLPIYWNKKVAKDVAIAFGYIVVAIEIDALEDVLIRGRILNSKTTEI